TRAASSALLDRIDLHLTVPRETTRLNASAEPGPSSAELAALVIQARQQQLDRQGCANAHLDLNGVKQHCSLPDADRQWLENACERLGLSLRAAHRVLKVARTLADLDGAMSISRAHLAEALQYRPSGSGS
ncbi:MAG: ATP-binding protein, partial [Pseudomonas sp.]|nr:ATP-binding protein [Pseudomonas sp.]